MFRQKECGKTIDFFIVKIVKKNAVNFQTICGNLKKEARVQHPAPFILLITFSLVNSSLSFSSNALLISFVSCS